MKPGVKSLARRDLPYLAGRFTETPLPRCIRFFFLLVWLCLDMGEIAAQPGGLVRKKIPTPTGPFQLDSLTLIFPTLRCVSDTSLRFEYDFRSKEVRISGSLPSTDSLELVYRLYPFDASRPFQKFPMALYDSLLSFSDYPGMERTKEKREELFEMPGIQKSGVISRGISVGNGQNGFVNSALNLQLEGQLSPEIRLTAVLSDQTLPFQPQGNTQQIRELDRIFIQLDHKRAQFLAGDVVLKNSSSQFLRYYKNIQGGQVAVRWDSTQSSQTRVGAGVAKGKFASVVVPVSEGVHGPYRLRPPDNPDLLVVILANSERIYFDNRLLRRGFNLDYVIDYNTGELTLNNNLLVTRFTRLRCDFEYAERNYSRTSLLAEHVENLGKAQVTISHYQEQDNGNRPLSFTLDSTSASRLNLAGDDPSKAVLPSAQSVGQFQEGQLYYKALDTLIGTDAIRYYRVALSGEADLWQVGFSEVGPGRGDYRLEQILGNGRQFLFVGPGNGDYLPVRFAVLPNQRSVTRAAVAWDLGKGHKIEMEGALSRFDKNRLSRLQDGDNTGNAQYLGYRWEPEAGANGLRKSAFVGYTRLSRTFSAVDRFRDIEFERDWNANSGDTLQADDHLLQSDLLLAKNQNWGVRWQGNFRDKGENVRGFQQHLDWNHGLGPFRLRHQGFAMKNRRSFERAEWARLNSEISLPGKKVVPSYTYTLDENSVFRSLSDSVLRSAMHFQAHRIGLRSRDTTRQILSLQYTYREDKLPEEGRLETGLFSQNAELRAGTQAGADHRFDVFGNYRMIRYSGLRQEEFITGRFDYQGNFWEGALRQEFVFTANTGQEARRDFQFIRLNSIGEGTHQWVDYNGNGLQELDEFVEAQRTEDRQYIKIFTPTNDLINAYTNALNYRLNLAAPAGWRQGNGIQKALARFSVLSSITADQKTTQGALRDRYLPFLDINRESVLSANRIFRNTLFWNRTRSDAGGEYSHIQSMQKTLLSNGFSLRTLQEHRFLVRKNLHSYLNLTQQLSLFERSVRSDALAAQNYRITGFETGPELSFQPSGNHRVTASGQAARKQNVSGEEETRLWKLGVEYRWNQQNSRSLNAVFRLTEIRHRGNAQSPAAYELLEGLLPGRNLTWGANLQQKLAQGLQLLFVYEGRQSQGIRTIHIGKMQANLLF